MGMRLESSSTKETVDSALYRVMESVISKSSQSASHCEQWQDSSARTAWCKGLKGSLIPEDSCHWLESLEEEGMGER